MVLVIVAKVTLKEYFAKHLFLAILAWLTFFTLMEMSIYLNVIKTILLSSPTAVLWKLQYHLDKGYLLINSAHSLQRIVFGFGLGIILAIPFGILFGFFNKLYEWISPLANFIRMVPPPAIMPFAIIAFGLGEIPKIFVITLGSFFPIFLATIRGVRETETIHREVIETMGGSNMDVLVHAVIPSAIPSIMTGIRIGFGIGWLVLISAELIGGDSGLGFMIQGARMRLDMATVFMGMGIICIFGVIIDFALKKMERYFTRRKRGGADYIYY